MNDFSDEKLTPDLYCNILRIKEISDGSSDVLVNKFEIGSIPCALIACEGMLSTGITTDLILEPVTNLQSPPAEPYALADFLDRKLLLSLDRSSAENYGDLFGFLNSGFAVLLIQGFPKALVYGVQGYDKRSVSQPTGESNILGAQDGFTETVRVNMSLIRRRMKTPFMKMELMTIGSKSRTDICLCYMYDRVPKELVDKIKKRLLSTELESILSTGYIQPFVESRHGCIFDTTGRTQRPDVLTAKLLEGRVGILIDGTPFALSVPKLLCESFQTMDDYCFRPYFAAFIRFLRYCAFFVSLLLPAFYVAVSLHHPELLNRTLLLILAEAEANAPLSLTAEGIGILLVYEIIREAGLRLPKAVGGSVSIVAGLIIGDAAVSSGLISTPMLTITAIAVISGFVVPDLNQTLAVIRILFILAGGFLGLFGIGLLGTAVIFNACSGECFGFPVTAPVSPFRKRGMRDVLARVSFRKMQSGNFTVEEYHE